MELRTKRDALFAGSIAGRNEDFAHDARAAHALKQAVEEMLPEESGYCCASISDVIERADEIMREWTNA